MTQPHMTIISLQKLIGLKAEILCEGHFGVYQPANEVKDYRRLSSSAKESTQA